MSKEKEERVVFYNAIVDDQEREIMVRLPDIHEQRDGQKEYNRAWTDAVKSGALLRSKLEDFMKEQNLWDDEKEREFANLGREINNKELALAKGGIKLSDARKIAIELRELRSELRNLVAKRMELDVHTAEGQADNARFNYWVSKCLVYNDTKKPVFSSIEEYLRESNKGYAVTGASKLAELLYNLDPNFENDLEENKFLREYKFVDENGRLVDKDGRLIDTEGRLVDEDGDLINDNGEKIDTNGNTIDSKGHYKVEKMPFLDDDGNPVLVSEDATEK